MSTISCTGRYSGYKMIRYEKSIIRRLENLNDRDIILVGDDYLTEYISKDLKKMNRSFHYIANVVEADLMVEKTKQFVLVAVYSGHKAYYDFLLSKGLIYNVDFAMMNIGGFCREFNAIDPLLGYCRKSDAIYHPYDILGEGKYKIAIYGSSTCDMEYAGIEKNWIFYLYQYLKQMGIETTILAGGCAGYSSGQELLKIIRDINIICPDMVIDFSGVNDVSSSTYVEGYPFVGRYYKRVWDSIREKPEVIPDSFDIRNIQDVDYGIKDLQEDFEIWSNNIKKMNAVCSAFSVKFLSILEPMVSRGNCVIDSELQSIMENAGGRKYNYIKQNKFCDKIIEIFREVPFFVDFSSVFSEINDVYLDGVHYADKGHKIVGKKLAEIVYKRIDSLEN